MQIYIYFKINTFRASLKINTKNLGATRLLDRRSLWLCRS